MSFLDNLEDNLKALENREQGGIDESRRRDADRERVLAVAPWAERLKASPFTSEVMKRASLAGRERRIKVNLIWLATTLRLEARDQRLEFRPEPDGIIAVFMNGNEELRREPVDLEASPDPLIASWMTTL